MFNKTVGKVILSNYTSKKECRMWFSGWSSGIGSSRSGRKNTCTYGANPTCNESRNFWT